MQYSLKEKDLKQYPHFDAPVDRTALQTLVNDPDAVAAHAFFPFLVYEKGSKSLQRRLAGKPAVKNRPIRYAARVDAAIFARYRALLSDHYETELAWRALDDCVLAYRSIKDPTTHSGKCNIHFAKDAFDAIRGYSNCTVYAFDISSYFENIDHAVLKQHWCNLLDVAKLPIDHFRIFKAITNYAHVQKSSAIAALGYDPNTHLPKQLCEPHVFREKIANAGLIEKNKNTWGIPQGSPISDVLANLYLLDFDTAMQQLATSYGGVYYRYSDDILLILPDKSDPATISKFVQSELTLQGARLSLSDDKTVITQFQRSGGNLQYEQLSGGTVNGIEYLGFRFDGQSVFLRDSTVSRLHRKISRACKHYARTHINKNPEYTLSQLMSSFDFSVIEKQFGKVQNFEPSCDKREWTFWTYASKARQCFGRDGLTIGRQLRKQKCFIRSRFENHLRNELL